MILDNYFTGRKANIAQWIGHPRFELIRQRREPIKLEWIGSGMACPALDFRQFNPVKTAKTSFLGIQRTGAGRVGARLLLAPVRSMAIGRCIPSRKVTAVM